jgi:hypothetical protein
MWRGGGIVTAAAAGVVTGGAMNLLLNIPAIWRTWGKPSAASGDAIANVILK